MSRHSAVLARLVDFLDQGHSTLFLDGGGGGVVVANGHVCDCGLIRGLHV